MAQIQHGDPKKSVVRENPYLMGISCKKIIKLDDSIRFVGIASEMGQLVAIEYQKGLDPILSRAETEWLALLSVVRKESRTKFQNKLGEFNYSIGTYDKVKRATIYLEEGFILLVSFEVNRDSDEIILKILKLLSEYKSNFNSSFIESMIAIAEEKIKQEKFASIGLLSARIAHDIRNPLSTIEANLTTIQKETSPNNKKINNAIKLSNKAVVRISHQVNEVMDFLALTPLQLERKSIKHLFKTIYETFSIPKNIQIHLPENDLEIECDIRKLDTLFINIILNAIQAMEGESGNIIIRILDKLDKIEIEIENDGPPIQNEIVSKIFEPLFTTKMQGTGLGLSGCKSIVKQHHGTVDVQPNPVVFRIVLPKSQKK